MVYKLGISTRGAFINLVWVCAQCTLCTYVGTPLPKAQDVQSEVISPESQKDEGDVTPPPKAQDVQSKAIAPLISAARTDEGDVSTHLRTFLREFFVVRGECLACEHYLCTYTRSEEVRHACTIHYKFSALGSRDMSRLNALALVMIRALVSDLLWYTVFRLARFYCI